MKAMQSFLNKLSVNGRALESEPMNVRRLDGKQRFEEISDATQFGGNEHD